MEEILRAFEGHVRVNEATGTVEVFDEYGVKMRLTVSAEALEAFKNRYPTF